MPERPKALPTTEDRRLPTEEEEFAGQPVLLTAFPKQVALPLPRNGETVGREWLAQANIEDPKVSRMHLRFSRRGSAVLVEDVGSRTGTALDSAELAPHQPTPLDDGQILRIGNTVLVYRESFKGSLTPRTPLGKLVGPWGLEEVHASLRTLNVPSFLNVLVEGETGTGKELIAMEIARLCGRATRFAPVNVAAITPNLFEGHLFGWERGAFTGSVNSNLGVLRAHDKGAVFLDEIEALPFDLQPKLLRFLQFREVYGIHATRPVSADLVVIAATNQPIAEMLERGAFRQDLAARFNVVVRLPPLRDRPEDLFAIFEALFHNVHRAPLDLARVRVDADAVAMMMGHRWLDNVREVERLVMAMRPEIGLKTSVVRQVLGTAPGESRALTPENVQKALYAAAGNQSAAARTLGVTRGRLLRLMKQYKLT